MTTYSYADKLFLRLWRLTWQRIPKEDYIKLWEWINDIWQRNSGVEDRKLEAIMKAINRVAEKYPELDILNKIKID